MTHGETPRLSLTNLAFDLKAGLVVSLVALPLCLGIALASNAATIQVPLTSGLIAGIIGGLVVGSLSRSQTSVSGPAAGLTAIVAAQLLALGSFEAFLLAVLIAGILQIGFGIARAGAISAFVPTSVIKGLLAAIGVILIFKQIPHLLGHDTDPMGESSFEQPDHENTFSELLTLLQGEVHPTAIVIGCLSIAILLIWDRVTFLKQSFIPGPLVVVIQGMLAHLVFQRLDAVYHTWGVLGLLEASTNEGIRLALDSTHMVNIPVAQTPADLLGFFTFPDFSVWNNPQVYFAAVTIAIVASLETLLNLEAVDKLDPHKRDSPPSRELIAQGCGNIAAGLLGGLPVTSVIVRGSVNVASGARTKASAVIHGVFLVSAVALLPTYINMIPLSSLAAILLVTGFKLASPTLFRKIWSEGRYQFIPFIVTIIAIVSTDLLIGVLIGLGVSALFILNANLRRPIHRIVETHAGGELLHIKLPNQVSFLNRAALSQVLSEAPRGTHVLVDARESNFIDPDIVSLLRDFREVEGPAHGVQVNLLGFRKKYDLEDEIQLADYSARERREQLTAEQVLKILSEGNRRFYAGERLTRDLEWRTLKATDTQHPMAVILNCSDTQMPVEHMFDLGVGDVFAVSVAGNVLGNKLLGSVEYAVNIASAKLIVVLGHTQCGAVTSIVQHLRGDHQRGDHQQDGSHNCPHLGSIVQEIGACFDPREVPRDASPVTEESFIDEVAERNVRRSVQAIIEESDPIRAAVKRGEAMVVGAMYDVTNGHVTFLTPEENV